MKPDAEFFHNTAQNHAIIKRVISLARATPRDFPDIYALQEENLVTNLAPDARGDGFVTTPFTLELMGELCGQDRFLVARDEESGALAGYAFMGSWAFCARWPAFRVAIARFPLHWGEREIEVERTFQYGPVCVASRFRGQGVLPLLFEGVKREMRAEFEIGTTWINKANGRSMHAHTQKLGLVPLDEFDLNDNRFVLLAFETRANG